MGRQRHTAEQIISKLREAGMLQGKGMSVEEVLRQLTVFKDLQAVGKYSVAELPIYRRKSALIPELELFNQLLLRGEVQTSLTVREVYPVEVRLLTGMDRLEVGFLHWYLKMQKRGESRAGWH